MLNLIRKLFGLEQSKPASAPKPASSVAQPVRPASQPQPTAPPVELCREIAALCKDAANGTPTTFMCYGSDEALFMARLKPFSAYAATRDGRLTVVGVRDDANKDFMIACAGSKSEDAEFSAASRSGGALDKLDRELLSEDELRLRRPVDAYSNFAQPGCDLMSMDGFNHRLSALRSGRYSVVAAKPIVVTTPATESKPATEQGISAVHSALSRLGADLRSRRESGLAITTLEIRPVMGRDCIAWIRQDDGIDFNSDRATTILKEHLTPLGINFWMGGHTTAERDSAMCFWFIDETPQPSAAPPASSLQVNRDNLEDIWATAMRHYKADRHSEALSHFQALFEYFKRDEYDPNFTKCAEYLGMCYVNASNFDKATELFNDVNSRGSFPSPMASWGLLLVKHKGNRDAATKEKYG